MPLQNIMQEQLTYPSIKPILQYSSFGKRCNLAKYVPSLRQINKNLPYFFNEIKLEDTGRTINAKLDCNVWNFIQERRPVGEVQTPKGVVSRSDDVLRDLYAFIRYYLRRENSRVLLFSVRDIVIIPDIISFKSIRHLTVAWPFRPNIDKSLTEFCNASIGILEVHVSSGTTAWMQGIKNLRCKELKIKTFSITSDDIFSGLNVKKLEIEESNTNLRKFERICYKLKDRKMEIGSCYSGRYPGHSPEFLNWVKQSQTVEVSGENFFTTLSDNSKTELLLTRNENNNTFRVEVVKAGTGKKRQRKEAVEKWWTEMKSQTFAILNDEGVTCLCTCYFALYLFSLLFFFIHNYKHYSIYAFAGSFLIQIIILACSLPPLFSIAIKFGKFLETSTIPNCLKINSMILFVLSGLVLCVCSGILVLNVSLFPFDSLSPNHVATNNSAVINNFKNLLEKYDNGGPMPENYRSFSDRLFQLANSNDTDIALSHSEYAEFGHTVLHNLNAFVNMSTSDSFWN